MPRRPQIALARSHGIAPDWRFTAAGFRDNSLVIPSTGADGTKFVRRYPLAYVWTQLDGTQVDVTLYQTLGGPGSNGAVVTCEVEGGGFTAATGAQNVGTTSRITVPGGSGLRYVRWTDGGQSAPNLVQPPKGCWLVSLAKVDGTVLRVLPKVAPQTRIVIVGNSIADGFNANTIGRQAMGARLRQVMNTSTSTALGVTHITYGWRSLQEDYVDGHFTALCAEVAAAAADVAPGGTVVIVLHLGVNDQGITPLQWPNPNGVNNFQAAYQLCLEELQAAVPGAQVVAHTIGTTTLGPNADGQTIVQFRTAQSNARAAVPGVVEDDGPTQVTNTDVTEVSGDGLHPQGWGQGRWSVRQEVRRFGAEQLYGAGPYSAGTNLLRTAAGSVLNVPNGSSLLVVWHQVTAGVANEAIVTCSTGTSADGTGWGFFQADGAGNISMLRYRPSGQGFGLASVAATIGLSTGLHAVAVSIAADGTTAANVDGGSTLVSGGLGAYVAPQAGVARLEFGSATNSVAFATNTHARVVAVAVFPWILDEYDRSYLSFRGLNRKLRALLEQSGFYWEAATDYDPGQGATPQPSRGLSPLSMIQTGTVARVVAP